MTKIFVGIMDNGSGDAIIRTISTDPAVVLRHLQRKFLEWREDDDEMMDGVIDVSVPTLHEMDERVAGNGVAIIELDDGAELYEELRNWEFEPGNEMASDDPRLVKGG